MPKLYNIGEASEKSGISKRFLELRLAAGTGPEVTRIGRRVLIREDCLARWIEDQTGEAVAVPEADLNEIADQFRSAVECYMDNDPVGAALVVSTSRYPANMHAAAAQNVIARMVAESPEPGRLLGALVEIVARD